MNLSSNTDNPRPIVNSPGAYKWWNFECYDPTQDIFICVQFHIGTIFSGYYLEALHRYFKQLPSTQIPFQSSEFNGLKILVVQNRKIICDSLQEFPLSLSVASDDQTAMRMGYNRFVESKGAPLTYTLTAQAPSRKSGQLFRLKLIFTTLVPFKASFSFSEYLTHQWIATAPFCQVDGICEWVNLDSGACIKSLPFLGHGHHDHHYGSIPLFQLADQLDRGFHISKTGGMNYIFFKPKDLDILIGQFITWNFSHDPQWIKPKSLSVLKTTHSFFGIAYPKKIQVHLESPTYLSLFSIYRSQLVVDHPLYSICREEIQNTAFASMGFSTHLALTRFKKPIFYPFLKASSILIKPNSSNSILPPEESDVSTARPPIN